VVAAAVLERAARAGKPVVVNFLGARVEAIAPPGRGTAALEPLEREIGQRVLPNGLRVTERRVPIGTVGANFEARPNVALDVAGQLLKGRNAAVLAPSAFELWLRFAKPPVGRVRVDAGSAVQSVLFPAAGSTIVLGIEIHPEPRYLFLAMILLIVAGSISLEELWGRLRGARIPIGWIAAGGAAWAYVIAAAVIAIEVNGNARAYVQVFGLLIAAFFAHREAS